MLLIARRYLLSPKSHSVVNIISCVTLFALLLPVAAVIVLLSIFNGFGSMVEEMDGAMEGDLTITLRKGRLFERSEIAERKIAETTGVETISFITEQMALLKYGDQSTLLTLRGVDDNYTEVLPIEERLIVGRFDVDQEGVDRIVVGAATISKLGIRSIRDIMIDVYALKTGGFTSLLPMGGYSEQEIRLGGVVQLDITAEERYGFTSRRAVNNLIGGGDLATRVILKIDEATDIELVKATIQSIVGDKFKVETRGDMNPMLYHIIRYEKLGVILICSLVMILAAFSLIGALTMLIIEKRGNRETLRAMGATHRDIKKIFLMEGGLISGTAILSGVVIGVAVTLAQGYWGFIELPSSSNIVEYYPVELQLGDVACMVTIAATISLSLSMIVINRALKK